MFLSGQRSSWWDFLTPKDWRHVSAFGWGNDRWVVYDVADIRSRVSVMNDDQFDQWFAHQMQRTTAMVRFSTQSGGDIRARFGLWCVTAVKHLVGSNSSALRPKALFRDLVAQGAEVTFYHGRQSESS